MKKKTTAEKELSGTNRPDKTKVAKKGEIEIPPPETYLNAAQKKIYYRICEHINEHSLLQSIDSLYVSQAAVSFSLISKYTKLINRQGATQTYDSGAMNISAYYSVLKGERLNLKDAIRQLGLTVKAREDLNSFSERITPLQPSANADESDPFARKLKRV